MGYHIKQFTIKIYFTYYIAPIKKRKKTEQYQPEHHK